MCSGQSHSNHSVFQVQLSRLLAQCNWLFVGYCRLLLAIVWLHDRCCSDTLFILFAEVISKEFRGASRAHRLEEACRSGELTVLAVAPALTVLPKTKKMPTKLQLRITGCQLSGAWFVVPEDFGCGAGDCSIDCLD